MLLFPFYLITFFLYKCVNFISKNELIIYFVHQLSIFISYLPKDIKIDSLFPFNNSLNTLYLCNSNYNTIIFHEKL